MSTDKFNLSEKETSRLIEKLKVRFDGNKQKHKHLEWNYIEHTLISNPGKLRVLNLMEQTGGEPDVVLLDDANAGYYYLDCSSESPKGRRSTCYDPQALEERKEYKPKHSASGMAEEMGIELLTEDQYFALQKYGTFDTKTSSWLKTPAPVREKGGAIFGDHRYGRTFVYHNGAQSYYASRGFRGCIKI